MDNFILWSSDHDEHLLHLDKFLMTASYFNMKLSVKKMSIGLSKQNILGYSISHKSIYRMPIHRHDSIKHMPSPTDKKSLASWLGLMAWFQHGAKLRDCLQPLRKLAKKSVKFSWTAEHEQAFQQSKEILLDETTGCRRSPMDSG